MFAPPETVDGVERRAGPSTPPGRSVLAAGFGRARRAKYGRDRSAPAARLHRLAESRVSLYGDSFTYGDEVDDGARVGDLLARKLGARVSKLRRRRLRTDQAYLRYVRNVQDRSPVVVLDTCRRTSSAT
jgi:hypothetical protein